MTVLDVEIVHDHLVQRGGAERVVLSLANLFPERPVVTGFYDPSRTYPEYDGVRVRPLLVNQIPKAREHHRLFAPLLAPSFAAYRSTASVTLCSSSGWAHGVRATNKVIYFYSPARWLYSKDNFLRSAGSLTKAATAVLHRGLLSLDKKAMKDVHSIYVISTEIQRRVRSAYGIESEVIYPPTTIDSTGALEPVPDLEPGYLLCVSRLLPYKNVHAVLDAASRLPGERFVIVGSGPEAAALNAAAPSNVRMLERVSDSQLRWLYSNCRLLVAPAFEDYGLTPLEAATFGRPSVALRSGGYLDTIVSGETGIHFESPEGADIVNAICAAASVQWDESVIRGHAGEFSEERFAANMLKALAAAHV